MGSFNVRQAWRQFCFLCWIGCHATAIPRSYLWEFKPSENNATVTPRSDFRECGPSVNNHAVIELAIFCDQECSDRFHGNKEKLTSYWGALLWDVQLKFFSLKGVDISFRVNSVTIIEESDQKQFIEQHRLPDKALKTENVVHSFGSWLYEKAESDNLAHYDIAILAVGSRLTENILGFALVGGACHWNIFDKSVASAFVVTMRTGYPADLVAHEMAHLLGAPHDTEEDYALFGCKGFNTTSNSIVAASVDVVKDQQFLGFSPCSKSRIGQFLKSEQARCLKKNSEYINPVIDTATICRGTQFAENISAVEQCQILANDLDAYVETTDGQECRDVRCSLNIAPGFSPYAIFKPFDGTKCGINTQSGHCLMDTCVTGWNRGHFINLARGMCIGSNLPFTQNVIYHFPITYDCFEDRSMNILRSARIEVLQGLGAEIKFIYLSENQVEEKCLTLNSETVVVVGKCDTDSKQSLWKLELLNRSLSGQNKIYGDRNIVNLHTHTCLGLKRLVHLSKCNKTNGEQQWRFSDGKYKPPCSQKARNRTFLRIYEDFSTNNF